MECRAAKCPCETIEETGSVMSVSCRKEEWEVVGRGEAKYKYRMMYAEAMHDES